MILVLFKSQLLRKLFDIINTVGLIFIRAFYQTGFDIKSFFFIKGI